VVAVLTAVAGGALLIAPYLFAEIALRGPDPAVGATPHQRVEGRWVDDYFVVETLDDATFAIGEPRYYQGNYSYLIVGSERALLFDAGTGQRDIVPVVRSLTSLPVTVVPSHLHFDHVGALGRLDHTALLDVGDLRQRAAGGTLQLDRYEFLGFVDRLGVRRFRVDEWWRPGAVVDLGGRRLTVLHTPGHTPTSLSLHDVDRHWLFCGDFVYPGTLYAFLPGASRAAYRQSTSRLLAMLAPGTVLFTAHLPDDPDVIAAPRLAVGDLAALAAALRAVDDGRARASGFYPRVYPVNARLRFATGWPWNLR
jgi:glyoxylase-like metal-dependent hydrolase (beta-lactamase superfamily II)